MDNDLTKSLLDIYASSIADGKKVSTMIGALRKLHSEEPPDSLIHDIAGDDIHARKVFAARLNKKPLKPGEFRIEGTGVDCAPNVDTRDEEYDAMKDRGEF